jgi:hypothetical protein
MSALVHLCKLGNADYCLPAMGAMKMAYAERKLSKVAADLIMIHGHLPQLVIWLSTPEVRGLHRPSADKSSKDDTSAYVEPSGS